MDSVAAKKEEIVLPVKKGPQAEPGGGLKRKAEGAQQKSKKKAKVEAPKDKKKSKPKANKKDAEKKKAASKPKKKDAKDKKSKSKAKGKKNEGKKPAKKKAKKSVQGNAMEKHQRKVAKRRGGKIMKKLAEVESESDDEDEVEDDIEKKTYHRTKKVNRKKLKTYDEMPISIVDEHDGSMVAILRALEQGYLPMSGMTLIHFDSHPDLGNIPDKFDAFDDMYKQKYNIRELYDTTDIATWITPMVLMGHFDTVVWACAHWCTQFTPGSYDLLVGKDKNDGCIKIAAPNNKKKACLEYWESGGTTCKVEDFEYYRPWTLVVIRYNKSCRLPDKQWHKMTDLIKKGKWVLDIDEDFFSCNNPYFDEFRDLFGEKMHNVVKSMYENDVGEETESMEEIMMTMFRNQTYTKPWGKFSKTPLAKDLLAGMTCPKKKTVLKQFHTFLRTNWPHGGMDPESSDEEEEESLDGWDVRDFFTLDDLHRCGQLACLPHHIATAKEIKDLMNEADALFDTLPKPLMITVATSRLDRYLPDSQAATIHGLLESLLTNRYGTETVVRLDRPNFSVENGESAAELEGVGAQLVTDILLPEPKE